MRFSLKLRHCYPFHPSRLQHLPDALRRHLSQPLLPMSGVLTQSMSFRAYIRMQPPPPISTASNGFNPHVALDEVMMSHSFSQLRTSNDYQHCDSESNAASSTSRWQLQQEYATCSWKTSFMWANGHASQLFTCITLHIFALWNRITSMGAGGGELWILCKEYVVYSPFTLH